MSSIICPNCRLNVSPGEAWCHHCGARLAGSEFPAANHPGGARQGAAGYPVIPEYGLPRDPSGLPMHWGFGQEGGLSLIHISEPTRLLSISYAVFCLKK